MTCILPINILVKYGFLPLFPFNESLCSLFCLTCYNFWHCDLCEYAWRTLQSWLTRIDNLLTISFFPPASAISQIASHFSKSDNWSNCNFQNICSIVEIPWQYLMGQWWKFMKGWSLQEMTEHDSLTILKVYCCCQAQTHRGSQNHLINFHQFLTNLQDIFKQAPSMINHPCLQEHLVGSAPHKNKFQIHIISLPFLNMEKLPTKTTREYWVIDKRR